MTAPSPEEVAANLARLREVRASSPPQSSEEAYAQMKAAQQYLSSEEYLNDYAASRRQTNKEKA